jgi:hypothetical protein
MPKRAELSGPILRATFIALTTATMAGWMWVLGEGLLWIIDNLTAI